MSSPLIIIDNLWNISPEFSPVYSLNAQSFYALVLLCSGAALSGLFFISNKKSIQGTLISIIIGLLASGSLGFGSVFLLDTVGVYV